MWPRISSGVRKSQEGSSPVTESQLTDLAERHLPAYKVPRRIIFVENIPHGPTGKIDRKTLRANAVGQLDEE